MDRVVSERLGELSAWLGRYEQCGLQMEPAAVKMVRGFVDSLVEYAGRPPAALGADEHLFERPTDNSRPRVFAAGICGDNVVMFPGGERRQS